MIHALYLCKLGDGDSWAILRCDECSRELPERCAMGYSCLAGNCKGTLRRIRKYIPKAERHLYKAGA